MKMRFDYVRREFCCSRSGGGDWCNVFADRRQARKSRRNFMLIYIRTYTKELMGLSGHSCESSLVHPSRLVGFVFSFRRLGSIRKSRSLRIRNFGIPPPVLGTQVCPWWLHWKLGVQGEKKPTPNISKHCKFYASIGRCSYCYIFERKMKLHHCLLLNRLLF